MKTKVIFKAGTKRLVHIMLRSPKDEKSTYLCVRDTNKPQEVFEFDRVVIQGPSVMVPKFRRPVFPLFENGKSACHLMTSAKLICYRDQ